MSKVLIVDDERTYRMQLETILTWEGYQVQAASNGREAIQAGARFRPDVLIADWMLKDQIHGLHVAEALRTLLPDLQTILITGFPSDDLRSDAGKARVFDFLEKPFDMDRIQESVRRAARGPGMKRPSPPIGVVELANDNKILFANERARELFSQTLAGDNTTTFEAFFAGGRVPCLDSAGEDWMAVRPMANQNLTWHIRAQSAQNDRSRFLVILLPNDPHYLHQHIIETLLETREAPHNRWPFTSRVLVIDEDETYRRFSVGVLEAAGATGYGTRTLENAIKLLTSDKSIGIVIVDFQIASDAIPSLPAQLRAVSPYVAIVGTSSDDRTLQFSKMGIQRFLLKPWRISNLIQLLGTEKES